MEILRFPQSVSERSKVYESADGGTKVQAVVFCVLNVCLTVQR